ncbi:hypothetical protein [Arthrobacter sp. ZGTC131]|uniref:hypothetical protein n=1 Tax=Arthrobacter sp. ZGTC131 TaxID=2058898 RepID=UPI0015E2FAFD|nr:hypothetical protein [Arthrobacter sp. ZGTC131]
MAVGTPLLCGDGFYDQIAWFSEPDGTPLLDGIAYTMTGLTKNEVSWRTTTPPC